MATFGLSHIRLVRLLFSAETMFFSRNHSEQYFQPLRAKTGSTLRVEAEEEVSVLPQATVADWWCSPHSATHRVEQSSSAQHPELSLFPVDEPKGQKVTVPFPIPTHQPSYTRAESDKPNRFLANETKRNKTKQWRQRVRSRRWA